ncbi:MAG: GNAT family N-acetyltransferase [Longibaculum sp.]
MIQFRKASLDDLELLVALRIRDLKMFSKKSIQEETIHFIRQFYYQKILDQQMITLLGYDQEYLVASASLYQYQTMPSNENPKGFVGQITNVWVHENYRHQGIATQMINELIQQTKNQVGMICLNASLQAIDLYKKCGFIKKENYFVKYNE